MTTMQASLRRNRKDPKVAEETFLKSSELRAWIKASLLKTQNRPPLLEPTDYLLTTT